MGQIYWIVGDTYNDTRHEVEYVIEAARNAKVIDENKTSFPQEGQCIITFLSGAVIKTLSSADATRLAGESPDGIIMAEAARQSFQAFRTLWTRINHKKGWLLVAGTFEFAKGRWFPDLWKECQSDNQYGGVSLSLPTYANPKLYPDGEFDVKITALKKTLSEEEYAERILGQPRPSVGVVFPEFRRSTHVRSIAEFDPGYPVRLWVDPGFYPSHYAVLFVQVKGQHVTIFDEVYIDHLVNEDVVNVVKNHDQWRAVEKVVIDVSATYHAGAQDPAVDTWRRGLSGRGVPIIGRYVKIEDGIQRTHDKLRVNPLTGFPYLLIHPRCENLCFELEEGYRYHVRKDMGIGSDKPIDKNNDACKALAYGLVDAFGYADGIASRIRPVAKRRVMAYDRVR